MMKQAIVTKFIPCTTLRAPRIKATCHSGSVTVEQDDALSIEANHRRAAMKLCNKFMWVANVIGGGMPKGGYVWVFADSAED